MHEGCHLPNVIYVTFNARLATESYRILTLYALVTFTEVIKGSWFHTLENSPHEKRGLMPILLQCIVV